MDTELGLRKPEPAVASIPSPAPVQDEHLPKLFGQYRLLERVGQGGNRTPANGSPDEKVANFGGGVLSRGGTSGWNELLFKFVVSGDRKPPTDLRLSFRRQEDRFGRPIDQPLPSITIEPPQDRKGSGPGPPSSFSR